MFHMENTTKFMFFRRMKINKNYENQLLCGNVLESRAEWDETKRWRKKENSLCVLHSKTSLRKIIDLVTDRKKFTNFFKNK